MTVWDESDEDEDEVVEVSCVFCGHSIEESPDCEHMFAAFDWTFGRCERGAGCNAIEGYREQIAAVFGPLFQQEKQPQWPHYEVQDLWDALAHSKITDPEEIWCCPAEAYKLAIAVWEEAGVWEHPGNLVSRSGGYSESVRRYFYAEHPAETCKKATKLLNEWLRDYRLVEKKPPKKKKKKR
jgi:hypothetical protein